MSRTSLSVGKSTLGRKAANHDCRMENDQQGLDGAGLFQPFKRNARCSYWKGQAGSLLVSIPCDSRIPGLQSLDSFARNNDREGIRCGQTTRSIVFFQSSI